MKYAEPLSQRHSARMSLTPEQHSHIAAASDKAAFDVSLPAQTRAAFAKKADWFRLLARIGEKCQRAAPNVCGEKIPSQLQPVWVHRRVMAQRRSAL